VAFENFISASRHFVGLHQASLHSRLRRSDDMTTPKGRAGR
jgi:hypothetical protein